MKRPMILFVFVLAPFIMGNTGGCGNQPMPTVEQINLHLPKTIRNCPYAPKSPGRGASKKRVGVYLTKLYGAWKQCHGNVKDINRLYVKWQNEVKKNNSGICPLSMVCD